MIWQAGRQANVGQLHPAGGAAAGFVRPVRIERAEPEAKRLVFRPAVHERGETARPRPGGISGPPANAITPRSPGLSHVADVIAGFFQQQRIDWKLRRQGAPKIGRLVQPPMPLAGQDRAATRRTRRRGDEGVMKQHALASNPVERRRLNHRVAVRPRLRPAPVISDSKQNVRARRGGVFLRGKNGRCDGDQRGKHDNLQRGSCGIHRYFLPKTKTVASFEDR